MSKRGSNLHVSGTPEMGMGAGGGGQERGDGALLREFCCIFVDWEFLGQCLRSSDVAHTRAHTLQASEEV